MDCMLVRLEAAARPPVEGTQHGGGGSPWVEDDESIRPSSARDGPASCKAFGVGHLEYFFVSAERHNYYYYYYYYDDETKQEDKGHGPVRAHLERLVRGD